MSKPKLTDKDIIRIWDLHKLGISNVEISRELNVSERTIRYHLGKGEPPNATGIFRSLSESETERTFTIVDILDKQICLLSKKLEEAEDIKITKPNEFLKATQALTDAIAQRTKMTANAKPERLPDKDDLLRKLDEKFLNGDLSPGEYQELKNRLMVTAQSRGVNFDIAYG